MFQAILTAREMLNHINFNSPFGRNSNVKIDGYTANLIYEVTHPQLAKQDIEQARSNMFDSHWVKLLSNNKIVINDSHPEGYILKPPFELGKPGPCSSNRGDVDASVSKNALDGTICFSIDNLRVHSPQSILREVFPLLMHEIVHLKGYGEVEAGLLQKLFADNYDSLRETNDEIGRKNLMEKMQLLRGTLVDASTEYTKADAGFSQLFLGQAFEIVRSLSREQSHDPYRLSSRNYAHPEAESEVFFAYARLFKSIAVLADWLRHTKPPKKSADEKFREILRQIDESCEVTLKMVGDLPYQCGKGRLEAHTAESD
ncbi:MAG: hypothetical protein ACXVA9_01820 [Bdellovibrionales bacterium]